MLTSIVLGIVLAQAAPPPAPTQPSTSVGVLLGHGRTWDDEGSIGGGVAIGATIEYRFRPKLSVNGAVERLAHDRDTGFLHFSGRTIFATIGATYHFAAAGVSPYVGGGFGGAFYKGTLADALALPPPGAISARSSTSTLGYGSAGVDVPLGDRVVISPDVRITLCQPQDDFAPWSAIRFGVKASVRF